MKHILVIAFFLSSCSPFTSSYDDDGCQCKPQSESRSISLDTFLAVGDGVTDNTVQIQNAVNAALAGCRSLYIPAGAYRITAPILITGSVSGGAGNRDGLRIYGDSPSRQYSTWHTPYSGHSTIFVTGQPSSWPTGKGIFEVSNLDGLNLENLWLLGNGAGYRNDASATTEGVRFIDTSQGHTINSCCFQLHSIGIDASASNGSLGSCGYSSFRDCVFTNCHTVGLYMIGGDTQIAGCFFNECRPSNASPTDFIGVGCGLVGNNYTITGGKMEWCSKGLLLYNCGGVAVTGVITDHNQFAISSSGPGTTKWSGKGLAISGCRFMASSATHISIIASGIEKSTGVISGCTFAKGDASAYDEGDIFGGTIAPPGDFMQFYGNAKHVWSISGNSMECASVTNNAYLGGVVSSFIWSGNSGHPTTSLAPGVTKESGL